MSFDVNRGHKCPIVLMSLKSTIEEHARDALKQRQDMRLATLRMLLSSLRNKELEKRSKEGKEDLTDEEIVAVIRSEMKKRKDAKELFEKGKRPDLAAKEETEARILQEYLPAECSDEQIEKAVLGVIERLHEVGPKDFGRVMGQAMARLGGRASGERVKEVVTRLLKDA